MGNNILKVTKSDGSIHFVPNNAQNKRLYDIHNSIHNEKLIIEEITEAKMQELIDNNELKNQTLAKQKSDLVTENEAQAKKIAELEAQINANKDNSKAVTENEAQAKKK